MAEVIAITDVLTLDETAAYLRLPVQLVEQQLIDATPSMRSD